MKKIYIKILAAGLLLLSGVASAQVGIGNTAPAGALDISSTNDGLLIPRIALTNTTTATVITPTASELVYNTTTINDVTPGYYYWDGSKWTRLQAGPKTAWEPTGNAGTTAANYVGTSDNVALKLATVGAERMRVLTNGQVVINNTGAPVAADRFSVYNTTATDFAINGYSTSTGVGVFGQNTATGYGVYGLNSSTGIAVLGQNTSTGAGVLGITNGSTSAGVFGRADVANGAGTYGTSNGNTGIGVFGNASGATGSGVYGQSSGTNGTGVFGYASNTGGDGVYGQSTVAGRNGVWGVNNNATGNGVFGSSTGSNGYGVIGTQNKATGLSVVGQNSHASGTAIIGVGNGLTGTYLTGGSGGAFKGSGFGAAAFATTAANGVGMAAAGNNQIITSFTASGGGGAFTGTQFGVTGFATTTNNAVDRAVLAGNYNSSGTTQESVYVGARIGGTVYKVLGTGAASVSTTMKTTQGERILFAPEAPENWFFDIGEVQLINGSAQVKLDDIFVECISDSKPFKVFVQGGENTLGSIRITRNQNDKSFTVEDLGGPSNGTVQYSVYAIWKTKENLRFPELKPESRQQSRPIPMRNLIDKSASEEMKQDNGSLRKMPEAILTSTASAK